jgi:hypothetical protein
MRYERPLFKRSLFKKGSSEAIDCFPKMLELNLHPMTTREQMDITPIQLRG